MGNTLARVLSLPITRRVNRSIWSEGTGLDRSDRRVFAREIAVKDDFVAAAR
jgi:hypothetical protein